MYALNHEKVNFITATFGIPMLAVFVMAVVESLAESKGWRCRMVRLGWDFAVLGVGVVGGIFGQLPMVQHDGAEAVNLGVVSLLVSIVAGAAIVHIRKCGDDLLTGARAIFAFGLGLAALAFPWYFVLR